MQHDDDAQTLLYATNLSMLRLTRLLFGRFKTGHALMQTCACKQVLDIVA